VERVRPAQLAVELTLTREVTHAKGDDVREWQLLIHGSLLLRCAQRRHPVQDGLTVMMSPRGTRQRARHAPSHEVRVSSYGKVESSSGPCAVRRTCCSSLTPCPPAVSPM